MASLGTGNITVLYGARNKYKIREVSSVLVQRLVELYAASGQVGFVTSMRNDGALVARIHLHTDVAEIRSSDMCGIGVMPCIKHPDKPFVLIKFCKMIV